MSSCPLLGGMDILSCNGIRKEIKSMACRPNLGIVCPFLTYWESEGAREGIWPMAFWPGIYWGRDDKEGRHVCFINQRVGMYVCLHVRLRIISGMLVSKRHSCIPNT